MLKEYFNIFNYKELHFNDFGDRVAQLLHVELGSAFSQWRSSNIRQEILIVNTHLLFPHDSTLSLVRLQQVSKHINVTSNLNLKPNIKFGVSLRLTHVTIFFSAGLQDSSIRRIISEWFSTQANANHALRVNWKPISMYFFFLIDLNHGFIYCFLFQWLEWKQTWTCLQVPEVSGICIILRYSTWLHWCRCGQGHKLPLSSVFFLLCNVPTANHLHLF